MTRLLITGTRHGWHPDHLRAVLGATHTALALYWGNRITLVHGDAPGVDTQARLLWEEHDLPTEAHPADWSRGRRAGPERNQRMVDAGAITCIGFVHPSSRGTLDCLQRAEEAGITTERYNWGEGWPI